jgi:hypothetical protein
MAEDRDLRERASPPAPEGAERALAVHERIRTLNQAIYMNIHEHLQLGRPSADKLLLLFCECGKPGCSKTFPISVVEYDRVRSSPGEFIVEPGYEPSGGERLVYTCAEFLVYEKA